MAPLPTLPANSLPVFGRFSLPRAGEAEGPATGLTLDQAIERLIRANLDLISRHYEIPQTQADIITAGLRANPLIYADSQLVPYGAYSRNRPGGPTQYDLNITHPIDFSGKRHARVDVAQLTKRVLESQFKNEVRVQIDNLYTEYVNVLAARETLRFAQASVTNFTELLRVTEALKQRGGRYSTDIDRITTQRYLAETLLADAEGNVRTARRSLAVLLNMPLPELERLDLRGSVHDRTTGLPDVNQLMQLALNVRPDLVAYRLGVGRAAADVVLQRRNKYQDAYLLYQPFTFQDNAPFGSKSGTSWALGLTMPLPVYNRNQGNIRRAQLNETQTRIELSSLEKNVLAEVERGVQEYHLTRANVEKLERLVIPAAQRNVANMEELYRGGELDVVFYLNAQRDANDVLRQYLETLIRHRRSMLRLNTAVGQRILP
jgi:cobalt-zinc-cadmium efflux system outer membrane protein